jgi:uncharacterized membrane protein
MSQTKRNAFPDFLKGVAVILMIQVHLTENFALPEIFNSALGKFSLFLGGAPAAPVFLAVMGYFLAASKKSMVGLFKRGVLLLGLGLLLNFGRSFHLLIRIWQGTIEANPWKYLLGVDIFFAAGLSILFIAFFRKVVGSKTLWWVVAMLIAAVANPLLPVYIGQYEWLKYTQAFFWGYFSWSYFPVFPWLAFPLLGYVFYLLYQKSGLSDFSNQNLAFVLLIPAIVLVFHFSYGYKVSGLLHIYYHHNFTFFLWVLLFLPVWIITLKFFHSKFSNSQIIIALQWAGKNVTAIYVVQWIIIGNLATAIFQTQDSGRLTRWFFIISGFTFGLVWIYEKFVKKRRFWNLIRNVKIMHRK